MSRYACILEEKHFINLKVIFLLLTFNWWRNSVDLARYRPLNQFQLMGGESQNFLIWGHDTLLEVKHGIIQFLLLPLVKYLFRVSSGSCKRWLENEGGDNNGLTTIDSHICLQPDCQLCFHPIFIPYHQKSFLFVHLQMLKEDGRRIYADYFPQLTAIAICSLTFDLLEFHILKQVSDWYLHGYTFNPHFLPFFFALSSTWSQSFNHWVGLSAECSCLRFSQASWIWCQM